MESLNESPEQPKTEDWRESESIVSLVCGIVSWLLFGGVLVVPEGIGILLPTIFVPLIGLNLGLKSKRSKIATTGIWLNVIALTACIVLCIVMFADLFLVFREMAKRDICVDRERQIGSALHDYHDRHGALPPLYTVDEEGNPLHSWRVLILPYMKQQALYEQIRLDEPWDSDHNSLFHDQMPDVYKCPYHPGDSRRSCTYSAIAGWSFVPATEVGSVVGLKFVDFTGDAWDTPVLVEVSEAFNWMDPTADVTLEDFALGNRVGSHHMPYVYVWYRNNAANGTTLERLQNVAARKVAEKGKSETTEEKEPEM